MPYISPLHLSLATTLTPTVSSLWYLNTTGQSWQISLMIVYEKYWSVLPVSQKCPLPLGEGRSTILMARLSQPVAKKIATAVGAENFNILQNNGRIAHQVVDHVSRAFGARVTLKCVRPDTIGCFQVHFHMVCWPHSPRIVMQAWLHDRYPSRTKRRV